MISDVAVAYNHGDEQHLTTLIVKLRRHRPAIAAF